MSQIHLGDIPVQEPPTIALSVEAFEENLKLNRALLGAYPGNRGFLWVFLDRVPPDYHNPLQVLLGIHDCVISKIYKIQHPNFVYLSICALESIFRSHIQINKDLLGKKACSHITLTIPEYELFFGAQSQCTRYVGLLTAQLIQRQLNNSINGYNLLDNVLISGKNTYEKLFPSKLSQRSSEPKELGTIIPELPVPQMLGLNNVSAHEITLSDEEILRLLGWRASQSPSSDDLFGWEYPEWPVKDIFNP